MSHRPSSAAGSPLRHRVFAALWLAGMISNIGAWMQTVGAQWLLIERHSPSWEVALVQTAASLPVLLLAIPAGVLGEFLNRRRLLIVVQAAQLAIAGALWLLATGGQLTTPLLLVLTFALGACAALQLPAQQAVVPEIVDRSEIPAAAALSSVGVNVARAVGPAIAGLVVAQWGVAAVFALNAATFAVFLVTLLGWRGYQPLPIRPERVIDATRAGIRYILHAPVIRGLYLRLTWFLIPGSALWALLPVVANAQLHLDATGYGVLLGALGAGAVGAAFLLPRFRARWGTNALTAAGAALFAIATAALAFALPLWLLLPVLLVGGAGWIGGVATTSGTVQAYLPAWVRARGLSIYQLVLFGGMAVGSLLFGTISAWIGTSSTLILAATTLVALTVFTVVVPMRTLDAHQLAAVSLPLTETDFIDRDPDQQQSVTVLVSYEIAPENRAEMLELSAALEQTRRRTGARRWRLLEARESPNTIVEVFEVGSWDEHVAQHLDRQTGADADTLAAARALTTAPERVQHFLGIRNNHRPSGVGTHAADPKAGRGQGGEA